MTIDELKTLRARAVEAQRRREESGSPTLCPCVMCSYWCEDDKCYLLKTQLSVLDLLDEIDRLRSGGAR